MTCVTLNEDCGRNGRNAPTDRYASETPRRNSGAAKSRVSGSLRRYVGVTARRNGRNGTFPACALARAHLNPLRRYIITLSGGLAPEGPTPLHQQPGLISREAVR